jgi:polyphenol oxidase
MKWREAHGVRWLEAELPGARAAFSTRVGGISEGAFQALNLGLYTDDAEAAVRENRLRLAAALGREAEGVLFGFQVHAAEVVRREDAPDPNPFTADARPPEADGQATSSPALTPLVQVADCLPVALAGDRGVAMLHCGWRGLAAGIVERGAREVGATAAAVGPGIGPCCYEVGDEVLAEFSGLGAGVAEGRRLHLPEAARRLLEAAGLDAVEVSDLCTSCHPTLFFSHRRDGGRTGRQAGLAWRDA